VQTGYQIADAEQQCLCFASELHGIGRADEGADRTRNAIGGAWKPDKWPREFEADRGAGVHAVAATGAAGW